MLQQSGNMIDLAFAGRFLGKEAAAAVGSGSLLAACMIGFFTGIGVGTGITVSQAFGTKEINALKKIIQTSVAVSFLGGILVLILGYVLAGTFLVWLNTPDEILGLAEQYLRLYFCSLIPLLIYNAGSGILRALGNSKGPMLYQLAAGGAHVAANFLFIRVLDLGVRGPALAAICSQSLAAVLVLSRLSRLEESYRLRFGRLRIHGESLLKVLSVGIPAGIQAMVLTLSNLLVQYYINGLGVDIIAAFIAYFKAENFIYLPIMALSQANTVFAGQNMGAGKAKRVKRGVSVCIFLGLAVTLSISALLLLLSRQVFGLFSNDPQVIEIGGQIARTTFPLYFLYVFLEAFSSAVRGAGKAVPPMLITLSTMCVLRVGFLGYLIRFFPGPAGVAAVYPVTWAAAAVSMAIYYKKGRWMPAKDL